MPVLFIGHGSPMNAIDENDYTKMLAKLADQLPVPKSILTISAHWETPSAQILRVEKPKTIHDFGGFPEELYQLKYPAPGAIQLADRVHALAPEVDITTNWGLDHGAWSPLLHIYKAADIPVTQLSLSRSFGYRQHYELGKKLKPLRDEGVLIWGSGNLVHNLQQIRWQTEAPAHVWATQFDSLLREKFLQRDIEFFLNPESVDAAQAHLAIPSLEHYLPLLYVLGASESKEDLSFIFEGMQNASISMRSIRVG